MKKLLMITLGVLFSVLGFLVALIICGIGNSCANPILVNEFGGVIVSCILVLTGGLLVVSQIGK